MEEIFELIRAERKRQDEKWGEQKHDDLEWLAILGEEVGEVSNALLKIIYGGWHHKEHLQEELVQVAAVCVKWLEALKRRRERQRRY